MSNNDRERKFRLNNPGYFRRYYVPAKQRRKQAQAAAAAALAAAQAPAAAKPTLPALPALPVPTVRPALPAPVVDPMVLDLEALSAQLTRARQALAKPATNRDDRPLAA